MEDFKVEKEVMTQQEWLKKQRLERKEEFAPPTAYAEARFFLKNQEKSANKAKEQSQTKPSNAKKKPSDIVSNSSTNLENSGPSQNVNSEFNNYYNYETGYQGYPGYPQMGMSPLPNMAIPPPNMTIPPPNMPVLPPSIPPPPGCLPKCPLPKLPKHNTGKILDPMAGLNANPEPEVIGPEPRPGSEPRQQTDYEPQTNPDKPVYSKQIRLELHKRMKNQEFLTMPSSGLNRNIINKLEAFEDSDEEDEDEVEDDRGKGAEVAPPCDMDYYTSSSTSG